MLRNNIPNTKINIGNLTYGELEKISMACSDCGIDINIKEKDKKLIINSLNNSTHNLNEFNYNCLVFSPKHCINGDLYLDIKINLGKLTSKTVGECYGLQEKFNKKLMDYLFYKK